MPKVTPPRLRAVEVVVNKVLSSYEEVADKTLLLNTTKAAVTEYFSQCIDLSAFRYFYPTNGITDAMNYYALENPDTQINIEDGDYEYFNYVNRVKSDKQITYVSNPSARDGNYRTSMPDGNFILYLSQV